MLSVEAQVATELSDLQAKASEAAEMLKLLANERRLLVLCELVVRGEASVGTLAEAVGLSQSALSQHLARLRADGLVAARRDSQTVFYRVADPKVGRVLALLKAIYCP